MNKLSLLLTLAFAALTFSLTAQDAGSKYLKIKYRSIPLTQYSLTVEEMQPGSRVAEILSSIVGHYSMYVNLEDRSSAYVLDSTVWNLPRGTSASVATTIPYTLTSGDQKTYKHEQIMDQIVFSEGKAGDIPWVLTDETKTINGLKCYKAVAEDPMWMMTAWYTKDVPVATGPSVYQGLPGLVVMAEDFFDTIELVSIESFDEEGPTAFPAIYQEYMDKFNNERNDKYRDTEEMFLIMKTEGAVGWYEMIHDEPYQPNKK